MANDSISAPPIRGLLFDKDGTLFDFHATWVAGRGAHPRPLRPRSRPVARLAAVLDFDLDARHFARTSPMIAGTMEVVVDAVHAVLPEFSEISLRAMIRDTTAATPQIEVVPLIPLLDRLIDAGLILGLATNDSEAPARAHLTRAGILDRFAFVAGYDSGHGAKPGPGLCRVFPVIGLAPAACAMVGDSTHDLVSGARRRHADGRGPHRARHPRHLAPLADVVLDNIGALPVWLGLKG